MKISMSGSISSKFIEDVPIGSLLLDEENPRFSGMLSGSSQKVIAKYLWEEMHLDELIISIAVNGYYRQEPLLVTKKKDKFVVVEGNRRLASIQILTDHKLAEYVGARVSDLPKLTEERINGLKNLPVIKYTGREELWSYLSFRHVNGSRSWTSLSKAEYIAYLHEKMKISIDDILASIGDRNKTSIKLYSGLRVLRQGEKNTRFIRSDFHAAKFNFSHLYTIIQFPNTRKFLGINSYESSELLPVNPVPIQKKDELEEILLWLYGSQSVKQENIIKSQNPDLRMLDDIIGHNDALESLRQSLNLVESHEYTKQEDRRLESYISRSELNIRKAKSIEDAYKGDEELAKKVLNIIQISKEMHGKMTALKDR